VFVFAPNASQGRGRPLTAFRVVLSVWSTNYPARIRQLPVFRLGAFYEAGSEAVTFLNLVPTPERVQKPTV